jgi:hypothetical protein
MRPIRWYDPRPRNGKDRRIDQPPMSPASAPALRPVRLRHAVDFGRRPNRATHPWILLPRTLHESFPIGELPIVEVLIRFGKQQIYEFLGQRV